MNKLTPVTTISAGAHTLIPLHLLLKSPRNARKTPHSAASIESKAASIAAKGILQNLVVEPELDDGNLPTGFYFVTIGEGRRLAQRLRVERGDITDSELVPCVIDTAHDPHEISLDENVTREAMHPADQFEAFRTLNVEQRLSAEDIAARFGVTPKTVQQRLRLGAASPRLMAAYRADELNLSQLMAFCLTEDPDRQEAVFDRLPTYQRSPYDIRRALTEKQVASGDRRARFVGADAYLEAGGQIDRDLFTDAGDGYFTDPEKLTGMALDRLTAMAMALQDVEGWKWVEAHIDFPHSHGYSRVYPKAVVLSDSDAKALQTAQNALLALSAEYEDADDLPDDVDARMTELEQEIARLEGLTRAYDPEDAAHGGIIVSLDYHGQPKYERGFIRPEDLRAASDNHDGKDDEDGMRSEGGDGGAFRDDQDEDADTIEPAEPSRPLSDALVRDLSTQRTLGLRLALGEQPELATRALVHTLALSLFFHSADAGCLEIRIGNTAVAQNIENLDTCPTLDALSARHDAWAAEMPGHALDLWDYIIELEPEHLGSLLAHCTAATVCAVKLPYNRTPDQFLNADRLATALKLDMSEHWRPTARSYLGRVNKGQITDAVREAVDAATADRIAGFKKPAMAEEAEKLMAGTRWLPALLRTPPIRVAPDAGVADASAQFETTEDAEAETETPDPAFLTDAPE